MSARSRFLELAGALAVLGCLVALVTPLLGGAGRAFTGSLLVSGLLGLVFAFQNVRLLRTTGEPQLPPALVTTAFGFWFALAPLLYDPGYLGTAGVQFAGLLTASFAGYTSVAALAGSESPTPSRDGGI